VHFLRNARITGSLDLATNLIELDFFEALSCLKNLHICFNPLNLLKKRTGIKRFSEKNAAGITVL